jgi:hypothetical protein
MIIIGLDNGGGAREPDLHLRRGHRGRDLPAPDRARTSAGWSRFFPPVVTGSVITIIGITLIPVAAYDAGGGQFALYNPDKVPATMTFGSAHQPEPGVLHHRS